MEINRENYEMYFLDYHEGRLAPGQVAELLVFLEANPEFKEEFETFEDILLVPDLSVSFSGKDSLKKNNVPDTGAINSSNYESYFIASTESLLSSEEQKALAAFLKNHPELKADFDLYQQVHIQPDLKIVFPAKAKLKRSILSTRRFYYYSLATAASVALLFSVYLNTGIRNEPKLADNKVASGRNLPAVSPKTQVQSPQEVTTKAVAGNDKNIAVNIPINSNSIPANPSTEAHASDRIPVQEIRMLRSSGVTSRDIVEPRYAFIRLSRNSADTYTNLYDQVNLVNQMKNNPVLAPVASSPKNIFRSGLNKLGSVFTGKDTPVDRNTINFWTLADLGISGYNLLTDNDLRLLTKSDDNGRVMSYALKSDEFEFERNRNK